MSELTSARREAIGAARPELILGDVIGSGAGGWVVAAFDSSRRQPVAVKVLSDEPLQDQAARDRMRTEAGILASCHHPHIVRAFDFHDSDDMMILIMERIDAESVLERNLRSGVALSDACSVVSTVARALDDLHGQGFLHGDVKPENVLFDPSGRHRLIDFGLARRWPFPVRHQVSGTPWYMAPEAIVAGGQLLPATDVYALGMMFYELVAGHLPYPPADGPIGIMRQQLEVPPLSLAVAAPHLPPGLAALVMAAIEKPIAARIASAGELADRLEAIPAWTSA